MKPNIKKFLTELKQKNSLKLQKSHLSYDEQEDIRKCLNERIDELAKKYLIPKAEKKTKEKKA